MQDPPLRAYAIGVSVAGQYLNFPLVAMLSTAPQVGKMPLVFVMLLSNIGFVVTATEYFADLGPVH
jgi:hypothetical protein